MLEPNEIAQLSADLGQDLDSDGLAKAMADMDPDGSGAVDLPEFRAWFIRCVQKHALTHTDRDIVRDRDRVRVRDRDREIHTNTDTQTHTQTHTHTHTQIHTHTNRHTHRPHRHRLTKRYPRQREKKARGHLESSRAQQVLQGD